MKVVCWQRFPAKGHLENPDQHEDAIALSILKASGLVVTAS